ncbi:efflux RND transporter permease subunit [Arthrobacter sp. NicSoilC12]|uniref:efflux RND transporter permease subunit n=1 Tax=Arthrobacter sp. NicSoilC12 TaxID=2831001 RepID=UPI0021E03C18|nr:efflux RND transporter permease subunit [Arthrobacter sp. NicSoilC12]
MTVNLAAAQKYGLKPGDVRRAAATLVAGEEVGDVFRDGRAYDVQVWSTPATRSSVTSIEDLPIDTPSGARVRLADVADVSLQATRTRSTAPTDPAASRWDPSWPTERTWERWSAS